MFASKLPNQIIIHAADNPNEPQWPQLYVRLITLVTMDAHVRHVGAALPTAENVHWVKLRTASGSNRKGISKTIPRRPTCSTYSSQPAVRKGIGSLCPKIPAQLHGNCIHDHNDLPQCGKARCQGQLLQTAPHKKEDDSPGPQRGSIAKGPRCRWPALGLGIAGSLLEQNIAM